MIGIAVGERAPSFRLPSARGGEVALDDFRGVKNVIVWFTKGMACPFCRQHMSQIARGYNEFQKLSGEVLEIGLSTPARARLYTQKFTIPFPYLCDPDYRVRREWRLGDRRHSAAWYVSNALKEIRIAEPASDFGALSTTPHDFAVKLYDVDMGFFIVDREGIVRYSLAGTYGDFDTMQVRTIPNNDVIVRELKRLVA